MLLLLGSKGLLSLLAACAALVLGIVGAPDAGAAAGADAGGGDADAGGAGADAGAGDDAGADGQDETDRAAAGADAGEDPDDDFDDDDPDAGVAPEVRNDPKQLRTQLRRTQRQYAPLRPLRDRLRGSDGRYLSVEELDRRFARARDQDELESFLNEHRDLKQALFDRYTGASGRTAAAAGTDDEAFQDPYADEATFPFDTTTDSGRALRTILSQHARENHDLRQTIRRLERSVGSVAERETHRTVAQHEDRWKTATLAAVAKVPEFARPTFVHAVQRAFDLAKERKQLDRVDVRRILQEELAPFERAAKGQKRTDTAGRQTRAEGNRNLPRPNGQGRTAAAAATDTNKGQVGTIREGRKAFFQRLGMGTPPVR